MSEQQEAPPVEDGICGHIIKTEHYEWICRREPHGEREQRDPARTGGEDGDLMPYPKLDCCICTPEAHTICSCTQDGQVARSCENRAQHPVTT